MEIQIIKPINSLRKIVHSKTRDKGWCCLGCGHSVKYTGWVSTQKNTQKCISLTEFNANTLNQHTLKLITVKMGHAGGVEITNRRIQVCRCIVTPKFSVAWKNQYSAWKYRNTIHEVLKKNPCHSCLGERLTTSILSRQGSKPHSKAGLL